MKSKRNAPEAAPFMTALSEGIEKGKDSVHDLLPAGLGALGYPSILIVRPSLIDADRAESRIGERIGILLARALRPVIPPHYRAVAPDAIAKALVEGALAPTPGLRIVESEELA